jgi:two-component system, NarL family, nitrate/nitrite response regulator NarL
MHDVMIFSDQPLLLAGLQCGLVNVVDFNVCYRQELQTLVSEIKAIQPDAVLLDFTSDSDLHILRGIRDAAPECRMILWATELAPEIAWHAVELGARGVVRKTQTATELVMCLRAVCAGELWFDRSLTTTLLTMRPVHLTKREGELVTLLAHGLKNKEIATALDISEGTVKVYISRLFEKVGAKDRLELALYGLRNMNRTGENLRRDTPNIDSAFRAMVLRAPAR